MQVLSTIASVYILFMAPAGFLFGQNFEVGASLAGVFGAAAAVLSFMNNTDAKGSYRKLIFICVGLALTGVALDAANYYMHLNITGNYYSWFSIAPLCAALLLIAFTAWQK